ncbi:hypothetical protein [Candidatus Poriferisodalis sp.]|uniref:hypothetical protein n=1 Tax=Candidatus Poriferisodalis sp. TaxID=3101277 RepID=UPI003C6F3D52
MSNTSIGALPAAQPDGRIAWVVRSGRKGKETVDFNLRESMVTLGWGDWVAEVDVADHGSKEELDEYFEHNFSEFKRSKRRTARHKILRFRDQIREGDIVVLPLRNSATEDAWIAIGEVTGPMERDPRHPEGAYLFRRVKWLQTAADESSALPDLVGSIKQSQPTVFRPRKAKHAAERLMHLAAHGTDPGVRP